MVKYWEGFRYILLLKWVYPYKELIAGITALGGGAFVVLAGREQISHLRESKKRERLEQALDSFYIVGTTVFEYYRKLKGSDAAPEPIPMPEASVLKDIAYISPQLTQHFVRIQNRTSSVFERCQTQPKHMKSVKKSYLAYSYCLFQIFRQIGKNAKENSDFTHRLNLSEFQFDCTPIEQLVEEFGLEERHLGGFKSMFPLERFQE